MCERERDMGMVTKCVCRRGVDGGKRFSNGVPITGRERQSVWGGEVSLTLWAHTHHPPPSLHPALHHSAPPPLLPHTLHHLVPDLPAHTYLFSLPGVRATGHRLWQTTTHTHPSPSYTLTVRTQRPHCSSTFLLFDIIKKKILTHVFTSTCKTLVHIHTPVRFHMQLLQMSSHKEQRFKFWSISSQRKLIFKMVFLKFDRAFLLWIADISYISSVATNWLHVTCTNPRRLPYAPNKKAVTLTSFTLGSPPSLKAETVI